MKRLIWLFCLALLLMGQAPAPGAKIFILIGQSNMAGRAAIEDWPATLPHNGNRIWNYRFDGTWQQNPRESLHDQTNTQYPVFTFQSASLVGPGLFFADQWASFHPTDRIVVVPCARHGSYMQEWQSPKAGQKPEDTLYGACRIRWKRAALRGTITGVLIYQGESNADTADNMRAWRPGFTALVTSLRRDIANPNLPIVFAQIGPNTTATLQSRFPYWQQVQSEQALVRISNVKMIKTSDLTTNEDGVHLDVPAQRKVGNRFSAAMGQLVN